MLFAYVRAILSKVNDIWNRILGDEDRLANLAKQQREDTAAILERLDAIDKANLQILAAVEPKAAKTLVLSLGTPEPQSLKP